MLCFYRIYEMEFPTACLKSYLPNETRYLQLYNEVVSQLHVRKVRPFRKSAEFRLYYT